MKIILIGGSALAAVAAATAALAQHAAPPKVEAVYWLSAETVSGIATGRPGGIEKNLVLQLGSIRSNPAPEAAHLPPAGLRTGERLPLISSKHVEPKGDSRREYRPDTPDKIKGRIELYWGCGETAPAGQPFVVDLSTLRPGSSSPFGGVPQVTAMTPPSQSRHAGYGEWPNGQRGAWVAREGSLIGEHVVRGNYSPEMRFAVAAGNDFLAPLAPRHAALPSGAVNVSWPALNNARGYILTVVAARSDGTTVMWTSSVVRMPGTALPDYLTQGDIARLVQQRVLLSPATTQCAVPAAVAKASDSAMFMMTAYGPEANFGSPREAPAGWAVKVRTKATHMAMLGMDMSKLLGGSDRDDAEAPADGDKPKKKRGLLRGVMGGALGIPG